MGSATSAMLQFIFQERLGVLTRERRSVVFASPNVPLAVSACALHYAPRRRPAFTKAMTSPTKLIRENKLLARLVRKTNNDSERASLPDGYKRCENHKSC